MALNTNGLYFTDAATGSTVFLRGVNVSGSAKLPFAPSIPSHQPALFFETVRDVSFIGRPFPLDEADEHFSRLRSWGFNFLRFCVTWEAIEHSAPRSYDFPFMDYVAAILAKAKQYGFKVFIDPHQDVWSRCTGGSGAPAWTIDAVGLDIHQFKATGAAIVHNTSNASEYSKMVWASNYDKLACATMFTVFYGGATFAPNLKSPEDASKSMQEFLQDRFCDAFAELAKRIGAFNNGELVDEVVIGYDTLNEPDCGWIGAKDLNVFCGTNRIGDSPTPFQALKLGSGQACTVEKYGMWTLGSRKTGNVHIDPKGESAWLPLPNTTTRRPCLWSEHGVWDIATSKLLKPDYFAKNPLTDEPVSFVRQFWGPFVEKFTAKIRAVHKRAIIFVEPCGHASPVEVGAPTMPDSLDADDRVVNSPHWYDSLTLINKWFNPYFSADFVGLERKKYAFELLSMKIGTKGIRKTFYEQICTLRDDAVIGEIGIPIDLENGRAYKTGNYTMQERALDANLQALESSFVSFTLWNYTPTNSHEFGDEWNGEDLSIWSRSDQKVLSDVDLNSGARALKAFCRPYPVAFPGTPARLTFDLDSARFEFSFLHNNAAAGTGVVEIYVPLVHYGPRFGERFEVVVSSGVFDVEKVETEQRIFWHIDVGVAGLCVIKIQKR